MAGMLQIITWLLAFYLVMKGVEILQIGLASYRQGRGMLIAIGVLSIGACIVVASKIVEMQDAQAKSMSDAMSRPILPSYPQ